MQSTSVRSTQDGNTKKTYNLLLILWVCGREVSEYGQAVDNVFLLSTACPHVPKGDGWSAGRVHISIGFSSCNGLTLGRHTLLLACMSQMTGEVFPYYKNESTCSVPPSMLQQYDILSNRYLHI